MARVLLDHGTSANVIASDGHTPLMPAFGAAFWLRDGPWPIFEDVLRRSSQETRRSVRVRPGNDGGTSAVDLLALKLGSRGPYFGAGQAPSEEGEQRMDERRCWAIGELLPSGAPVLPRHAAVVLPIAAAVGERKAAELGARRAEPCAGACNRPLSAWLWTRAS
jgi:hypothetical protein